MNRFLTDIHAIEERLKSAKPVIALYFDEATAKNITIINLAKQRSAKPVIQQTDREILREMGAFHMALEIPQPKEEGGTDWFKRELKRLNALDEALALITDGITDPQNLGAILRSGCLFGAELVIYGSRRSASGSTHTVGRASAGASEIISHGSVPNINAAILAFKEAGFWIYGADMYGRDLAKAAPFNKKSVLILGAEGKGLSRLTRDALDETLSIPTNGKIDSLNVSVAAGIILYAMTQGARR